MIFSYLLLFFIIKFVSLSWFLRNYHFYGLFTAHFFYEEEKTNMRYSNGYFWLPQNVCYCNENSLQKAKRKNHSIQKLQNFHEQSLKFELNNELLKTDINPFAPCAPLGGWKYRPTFEQQYLVTVNMPLQERWRHKNRVFQYFRLKELAMLS